MKKKSFQSISQQRSGMAIMIVLAFCSMILILGISYLKSFSNSTASSKLQLEQVQADFFAKGIQNIALLKVKKYPDFFLRSFRHKVYHERLAKGETLPPPIAPEPNPKPFDKFTGRYAGHSRDLLNHIPSSIDQTIKFTAPLKLATYSTQFSLLSANDFKRGFIEIKVDLQLQGKNLVRSYRVSVDASHTAILP